MKADKIGVIGAGAWGTALAQTAARAGCKVSLWAREEEVAETIASERENRLFLPGVKLDGAIAATNDLSEAGGHEFVLIVTPAQHTRAILKQLDADVSPGALVVLCAKGIEQGTRAFMSDVLTETLPQAVPAVLSGPSFAIEVANGKPAAVTIAGKDQDSIAQFAQAVKHPAFRPYLSNDMIGAQIGGAVKNVLAIACGIVEGKRFGESARAALITRGFAEMMRLGLALGAQAETLSGLSGLGDLILTCSSRKSRNMSLGAALGEGKSLAEHLGNRNTISEGVFTAGALDEIAQSHAIEMPICRAVHDITGNGADVDTTITNLLNRPLTREHL